MERRIVSTDEAPAAVGPYSQAVISDGWVWVSGQIPLDPATGAMVEGDVAVQARRCLDNVAAVLAAAGSSMDRVVRATVYLVSMDDFAAVNAVYATHFPGEPPARACVEVRRLPKDARVEIDAVARVG
jgi:2-iminobutanoate/2-iminopropanoate deaminase